MKKKEFDLIVFGATSFVGQILVQYLWKRHGLNGEIKWAIAGRDADKLAVLKNRLGEQARELPVHAGQRQQGSRPANTCVPKPKWLFQRWGLTPCMVRAL